MSNYQSDNEAQAREHNQDMRDKRSDLADQRESITANHPTNGMHEKCPSNAVKLAAGVYDCGDYIFVGDKL